MAHWELFMVREAEGTLTLRANPCHSRHALVCYSTWEMPPASPEGLWGQGIHSVLFRLKHPLQAQHIVAVGKKCSGYSHVFLELGTHDPVFALSLTVRFMTNPGHRKCLKLF
jgi:hypothetical protein